MRYAGWIVWDAAQVAEQDLEITSQKRRTINLKSFLIIHVRVLLSHALMGNTLNYPISFC